MRIIFTYNGHPTVASSFLSVSDMSQCKVVLQKATYYNFETFC